MLYLFVKFFGSQISLSGGQRWRPFRLKWQSGRENMLCRGTTRHGKIFCGLWGFRNRTPWVVIIRDTEILEMQPLRYQPSKSQREMSQFLFFWNVTTYHAVLTLTFDSSNLWQVNRYNLRGLAIVFAFIVLALIHLAVAAYAEARPKAFSVYLSLWNICASCCIILLCQLLSNFRLTISYNVLQSFCPRCDGACKLAGWPCTLRVWKGSK